MATAKQMKDSILEATQTEYENSSFHKCNLCQHYFNYEVHEGSCEIFDKIIPDDFISKVNKCVHWQVVEFDDPIPF